MCTNVYFHKNFIPRVITTYIHDFEDAVGESGGHVDDLLELGVGCGSPCQVLDMGVCTGC